MQKRATVPQIALVLVAPVVPDNERYRTPAFSRAGNMYITNVISSLEESATTPYGVISYLPIPSFPTSRRLVVRQETTLIGRTRATLLPFINLPLIKQVCIAGGVFLALLRLRKLKRGGIAPVVYTYNAGLPHGPSALLAARLSGMPAIASLNDVFEPGHLVPNTLRWRLNYWIERKIIPMFDGFVAVADRIMADLAPNRDYFRLEGAVADSVFERTETTGSGTVGDTFHIVFAGGLDRANGVDEMLEAFSLLRSPKFRLSVAGDGPLADRVRASAAVDPRIRYHGQLDFDSVLQLYKTADVLINMRLTEAVQTRYFYPSKMMEFLASGVPVISTCTGHTEAEFGAFVWLLRDESAAGLAALIQEVATLSPVERRRRSGAARRYMREHKTWPAAGRRLARYIQSVAAPPMQSRAQ